MNNSGFSLLSTLVSIILGSMLMSTMFVMYNNIGRAARFVKRISLSDTRTFVMVDRMQKDFSGMTTMWEASTQSQQEKEKEVVAQAEDAFLENKIFYSKNKGDRFDYLTFITTSALSAYAEAALHYIRVVYRLEPAVDDQTGFRLMRKELSPVSGKMSEEDLQGGIFSEVAGNITNMTVKYYYFNKEQKEKKEVKTQAVDTGQGSSVNTLVEWDSSNEDLKSKAAQLYPIATEVTVTFQDKESLQFRLDVPVAVSLKPNMSQAKTSTAKTSTATTTDQAEGAKDEA